MSSYAENIVQFMEDRMPKIKDRWREIYNKGYQARIDRKPRMCHGVLDKITWRQGWDAADSFLRNKDGLCGSFS